MTRVGPEELEHEAGRRGGGGDRRIGWIALAAALAVVLGVGGWAWSAHRRAATAEAALAEAVAARDAAADDAAQRQGLLDQAEAAAQAAEARAAELGQQVQAATAEANRLQAELAARDAAAASTPATPVAAADAVVAGASPEPAAPAAGGARSTGPAADEPTPLAAVEPAAAPPAEPEPASVPEKLAITFDVNSSYLPASLGGRLRELAEGLEPGRSYRVELVGSVGTGDVGGQSGEEALRYNRWMAERRMSRVAEFLQNTVKADGLEIRQDFALNDPSRQVVVEVSPIQD